MATGEVRIITPATTDALRAAHLAFVVDVGVEAVDAVLAVVLHLVGHPAEERVAGHVVAPQLARVVGVELPVDLRVAGEPGVSLPAAAAGGVLASTAGQQYRWEVKGTKRSQVWLHWLGVCDARKVVISTSAGKSARLLIDKMSISMF